MKGFYKTLLKVFPMKSKVRLKVRMVAVLGREALGILDPGKMD